MFSKRNNSLFGLTGLISGILFAGACAAAAPSYSLGYTTTAGYIGASASGDTVALRRTAAVDIFYKSATGWALQASIPVSYTASFLGNDLQNIALSGDTLLVGQTAAEESQIYVRDGSTWTLQQTIASPDANLQGTFGASTAMVGETAFIGDPDADSLHGEVFVYTRSFGVWTFQQGVVPPTTFGKFSFRVASSNATSLAVSSYAATLNTGNIYTFTPVAGVWTYQQTLAANSPSFAQLSQVDNVIVAGGNNLAVSVFEQAAGVWAANPVSLSAYSTLAISPTRFLLTNSPSPISVFDRGATTWASAGAISPTCTTCNMTFAATHVVATSAAFGGNTTEIFEDNNGIVSTTSLDLTLIDRLFSNGFDPVGPVQFTATVTGAKPFGQVVFRNGTATIDGCNAINVVSTNASTSTATCTAYLQPIAGQVITAQYLGDGNNRTSRSAGFAWSPGH